MRFCLVPTLERLRSVYGVPRGPERFQAYVDAAVGGARTSAEVALPPLALANPMAREPAMECLDRWIGLGAEDVARRALEEATARLPNGSPAVTVRVGLTLLDDVGGGWTNRVISDAARFSVGKTLSKTGWLSLPLWASEEVSQGLLRALVLESVHRAATVTRTGDPLTLRDMLRQEGEAAAFAGHTVTLGAEDLEYSRAVIAPHLDSAHQPTALACLYGDEGAHAWGYPPLGLSRNAGFEVGLADAQSRRKGAEP
ncbi:hypothetical protein [Deinococcus koreensis]|uniref:Uncharacterized protein n=1 Tax=Deinococcus koreensis TaxID=2054903 RepID=A0A2K3V1Y5_9DEIO|nr:hypothetical protein [Deinococcus koreensis]PNY82794.1 hypothetical protein CVO96_01145 [Deinococcus koreensis]